MFCIWENLVDVNFSFFSNLLAFYWKFGVDRIPKLVMFLFFLVNQFKVEFKTFLYECQSKISPRIKLALIFIKKTNPQNTPFLKLNAFWFLWPLKVTYFDLFLVLTLLRWTPNTWWFSSAQSKLSARRWKSDFFKRRRILIEIECISCIRSIY